MPTIYITLPTTRMLLNAYLHLHSHISTQSEHRRAGDPYVTFPGHEPQRVKVHSP